MRIGWALRSISITGGDGWSENPNVFEVHPFTPPRLRPMFMRVTRQKGGVRWSEMRFSNPIGSALPQLNSAEIPYAGSDPLLGMVLLPHLSTLSLHFGWNEGFRGLDDEVGVEWKWRLLWGILQVERTAPAEVPMGRGGGNIKRIR